ncbi:MAG: LysR family transcriptional regulator [Thermoguttaceae bacterium]|nr:LysR family transcriptional regulator [Thermoguttaceae bacterium]
MNTEMFRIFCDVVHYQSFSRGAEANGVSQSAATQSIHRLEDALGVTLIDRSKRPFILTPEGKICYEGFQEILETFEAVVARVQESKTQTGGTIRVAAIYSVGLHDMSKCMREFMTEQPKTKIRLEFLHPDKVYEAVLDAEADFGVVSYPSPSAELNVIPLRSEEMVVVLPYGHPLSKHRSLSVEKLEGLDYVAFDHDLPIRRETDRYMRQRNVRVNVVTELDNIETIKQAIEVGLGVSILPAPSVLDDLNAHRLSAVPLSSPKLSRPIGVIFRRRKTFSPATTRFIEMLGGALVKSNASGSDVLDEESLDQNEAVFKIEPLETGKKS